jgi:hypothetical protein
MVEDDESALDTAMYKSIGHSGHSGGKRQKVLVPIRLDVPIHNPNPNPEDTPAPVSAPDPDDILPEVDMDLNGPDGASNSRARQRGFYMKQFVSRAASILQALMAAEALPDESMCGECAEVVGKWRCCDCTSGHVLCRSCMRHSHFSNPFHRIECWTGTYFRTAALWEVGVYLCLHHHESPTVCDNLKWQQDILEGFQKGKDQLDLSAHAPSIEIDDGVDPFVTASASAPAPDTDFDRDAAQDAATMTLLDQMLQGHNPDDGLEDDEEGGGHDAETELDHNDVGVAGFFDYIGHNNQPRNSPAPAPAPGGNQSYAPQAPGTDALNNQYVRVVHTNGIHHIALVCCACRGQENIISDLIYARMVPTSFERIRTLFTASVLDQFRYCNLEMRSSAYQFFQMLRRITLPLTPSKVVNLYHELRRLSRLWRWIKKLKWAGYGLRPDQPINPQPGELASYCPACPQVRINLPENWIEDVNTWVYRRVSVVDGNFKAVHVRLKSAAEDVWLSDGLGMTSRRSECNAFLASAVERATVSPLDHTLSQTNVRSCRFKKAPCENSFRAIEQAMIISKACDITGIVAIACARHGCFAPNSIVDLTRGEQQKHVDWAFLEALRTTGVHPRQGATLIYDIICQYWIHLLDRIGHLLPSGLELDRAIGLFHVHGHKEECFYRYASSFIPGAGVVAGEILESLWSGMNTITPSTRTATLAHRAEIMDDHADDSNRKKALNMGKFLYLRSPKCA